MRDWGGRALGLAWLLVAVACGGLGIDGGQSGTGIALSTVSGQVGTLIGDDLGGDVAGIRVQIAETDLETTTGPSGGFFLEGAISGPAGWCSSVRPTRSAHPSTWSSRAAAQWISRI